MLAILANLVPLFAELLESAKVILELVDHEAGIALRHTLGLELEPTIPKRFRLGAKVDDPVSDLNFQVLFLSLEMGLQVPEFCGQVFPF